MTGIDLHARGLAGLVRLALAVNLPGDRLGDVVVTCLLWLMGAWLLAAASVTPRVARRPR